MKKISLVILIGIMIIFSIGCAASRQTKGTMIGAGAGAVLGGLGAAARLTQTGLRCLVLEKHTVPGGYAHWFQRKLRVTDYISKYAS